MKKKGAKSLFFAPFLLLLIKFYIFAMSNTKKYIL